MLVPLNLSSTLLPDALSYKCRCDYISNPHLFLTQVKPFKAAVANLLDHRLATAALRDAHYSENQAQNS